MKFDLNKPNGLIGFYFLGFSFPLWLAFMIVAILNETVATLIVAVIGAVTLIIGLVAAFMNSKEAEEENSLANLFFIGTILLCSLFMIVGNIAML